MKNKNLKKVKRQFSYVVDYGFGVISKSTRPLKVNWILVSYYGRKGREYQKRFEFPIGTTYEAMLDEVPDAI